MRIALCTAVLLLLVGSASLAADDTVIFSDNFSKLLPGWGAANDIKYVEGGKFVVRPTADTGHTCLYMGSVFNNADIRVKVCESDGGTGNTAGLVFWAVDTNNCYLAQLEPDGTVGVSRWMNGKQLSPVGYGVRAAVTQGVGQVNELRVVTVGKWAAVYVNDKPIAAFQGFPPDGGGRIGLHAESGDKPNTWQFSDLLVRQPDAALFPASASTPAADASLIYAANFATLDPAWGEADNIKSIADGWLILQFPPGTNGSTMYGGSFFGDFDLRIKVCETSGGNDQPAGVIFWAVDANNYYVAQARSNGGAGVSRVAQGNWTAPVPYRLRDAMKTGLGAVNELRVVAKGDSATFYVNDQEIAAFKGVPPAGGSKIGLRAASGASASYIWQFSDLVVRKPQ